MCVSSRSFRVVVFCAVQPSDSEGEANAGYVSSGLERKLKYPHLNVFYLRTDKVCVVF